MKKPRNRQKGIETSHWKVGEADDFHGVDNTEDHDIEPAPPESYGTDSNSLVTTSEQELIDLYKKRTGETLSKEDAKAARENIAGFFKTLVQWDMEKKEAESEIMKTPSAEPITVKYDTSRLKCAFCGKSAAEVNKMITGQRGNICDQCIKRASDITDDGEDGKIRTF
jgi:hypothetical protein